jgi:hypothetical protein
MDASGAAVGIPLAAYLIGLSLFALWFYYLLQPHYIPNLGLAAYKPPPATVVDYEVAARLPVQHGPVPSLAEIESRPEEPPTIVAASTPERQADAKKPNRPRSAARARQRANPYWHYAASNPWSRGNRPFVSSPWYGGSRAF